MFGFWVNIVVFADIRAFNQIAIWGLLCYTLLRLLHSVPRFIFARDKIRYLNYHEIKLRIAKVISPQFNHLGEHFIIEEAFLL
jgi:hypothetical protein